MSSMTPAPWLVILCACLVVTGPNAVAGTSTDFDACVADLRRQAAERGISTTAIEDGLAGVAFRERVIDLDRSQPEFVTSFADYFGRRVTDGRIEKGRELLEAHGDLLARIYQDYGVPPRYLVAIWGLETNYGGYLGDMPVFDSVATLACDGRRPELFTEQLMAALAILDEGSVSRERMTGSWAGAMGHVQFMPTVFREHAVDYDGDGRRDLVASLPDALASAAKFLRESGWQTGLRWGREVQVPDDFSYGLAGADQWRPLADWRALGVTDAYHRELPVADIEAALIVPAGHEGPAFLVYENFRVIMRWNRSLFYGLAVGRLADRLAGAGELRRSPPDAPRLSRDEVIALQKALNGRGYDAGEPDGIPGPQTRSAIRDFQSNNDMVADGHASQDVLERLDLATMVE